MKLNTSLSMIFKLSIHSSLPHTFLIHWGRVTHICVGYLTIIGSDNGLSPGRRKAIIWINAGILLIWPLGTNFSEILIAIKAFSFNKMHLKVSSAKRRPFCLGLNVLSKIFFTLKIQWDLSRSHELLWVMSFVQRNVIRNCDCQKNLGENISHKLICLCINKLGHHWLTHLPLGKMAAISQMYFQIQFRGWKVCFLIKISLKFVPKVSIENNPALVVIMAWYRIGDKPLSEPMLTRFSDTYMQHYGEMSWKACHFFSDK